jgi:hypothetical protein
VIDEHPRPGQQQSGYREPKGIFDAYVLDKSRGLYLKATRERERHPQQDKEVRRDWIAIAISALTLVLLFFTVRYTRKQWLETNRSANASETAGNAAASAAKTAQETLGEMRHGSGATDTHTLAQQAVTQATQTTTLATAAQRQADAFNAVQRAFVFPSTTSMVRIGNPQTKEVEALRIAQLMENSGTTPTRNMTIHINYKVFPGGAPANYAFPDIWSSIPHIAVPVMIGPKAAIRTGQFDIPASDAAQIWQGKSILYFWGWARYHDVFPNTPEHIMKFCYDVNGFLGNPLSNNPTEPVEMPTNNCERGNCYDEECKVEEKGAAK